MTVDELVQRTAQRLSAPELLSEDPLQEARELVAHALGILPAQLREHAREPVDAHQHGEFMRLLSRRLNRATRSSLRGWRPPWSCRSLP